MKEPTTPSPFPADLSQFLKDVHRLTEWASLHVRNQGGPLASELEAHLGTDPAQLQTLRQNVPAPRYVDWDIALEEVAARDPHSRLVGLLGGGQRYHVSLTDLIVESWAQVTLGQPEFVNLPSGADTTRPTPAIALRIFRYDGHPAVVMERTGSQENGFVHSVEAMSVHPDGPAPLLTELARLADERSLVRGQVLSLTGTPGSIGFEFLPRTPIAAAQVVLPDGALRRITDHVVAIAHHADDLRARGVHLKRGVLLYGTPGTGKTHTVAHLISELPQHTVVVLRGRALTLVQDAAAIARAMQPSVVVLEDCDLVAQDRSLTDGSTPLLFEVLDAVDGLRSDADVTFLFTTNRIDVLEPALAERPGRVDLAVELPLPDAAGRRQLLDVYAAGLHLTDDGLREAAERSAGMTASFTKELVRRTVMRALLEGREPDDDLLLAVLSELLTEQAQLARQLHADGEH